MEEKHKKALGEIASEMARDFDRWDRMVNDGFHPVAIQDLDYWKTEIMRILNEVQIK